MNNDVNVVDDLLSCFTKNNNDPVIDILDRDTRLVSSYVGYIILHDGQKYLFLAKIIRKNKYEFVLIDKDTIVAAKLDIIKQNKLNVSENVNIYTKYVWFDDFLFYNSIVSVIKKVSV